MKLMASVTAFEAKTRFGELLERVSRGEEIVITRHNQPVARIVPEGRPRLDQIQGAVRELRLLRQEIGRGKGFKPLSAKEIREATNEGRP
jgi:prevent-host-death family protein